MIKHLYKPSRADRKTGKRSRSRIWWGQFRLDPDEPIRRVSLKTTDKRVAAKRLDELVTAEEQERAGIVPARALVDGAAKPLLDHLGDLLADLHARGRSNDYLRKIDQRVRGLCAACGWKLPCDIRPDRFVAWRQAQDLSAKTLNDYLDAMRHAMGPLQARGMDPESRRVIGQWMSVQQDRRRRMDEASRDRSHDRSRDHRRDRDERGGRGWGGRGGFERER